MRAYDRGAKNAAALGQGSLVSIRRAAALLEIQRYDEVVEALTPLATGPCKKATDDLGVPEAVRTEMHLLPIIEEAAHRPHLRVVDTDAAAGRGHLLDLDQLPTATDEVPCGARRARQQEPDGDRGDRAPDTQRISDDDDA